LPELEKSLEHFIVCYEPLSSGFMQRFAHDSRDAKLLAFPPQPP